MATTSSRAKAEESVGVEIHMADMAPPWVVHAILQMWAIPGIVFTAMWRKSKSCTRMELKFVLWCVARSVSASANSLLRSLISGHNSVQTIGGVHEQDERDAALSLVAEVNVSSVPLPQLTVTLIMTQVVVAVSPQPSVIGKITSSAKRESPGKCSTSPSRVNF